MDAIKIRKKLHKLIDDADDAKLSALNEVISSLGKSAVSWWEDKNVLDELDQRVESWVNEKSGSYTLEDMDREIARRKSNFKK